MYYTLNIIVHKAEIFLQGLSKKQKIILFRSKEANFKKLITAAKTGPRKFKNLGMTFLSVFC